MSVYHGIRDIGRMRSSTLARLSLRIAVYGGAVGARFGHAARQVAPPAPAGAPPQTDAPRRQSPGPPASAADLRRLLAPVAGSGIWGVVREVKPEDQDAG